MSRRTPLWLSRLLYGSVGLLLLPAVYGMLQALFRLLVRHQQQGGTASALLQFLLGAGVWLAIFVFLSRPMRSYVLAHELSHALASWLSGGTASQLRVGKDGGSVHVSKSGILVQLAPYFVPFYTLVVLIVGAGVALFIDPAEWWVSYAFLLGFSWSFHISFTLYALSGHQSDLDESGWIGALPIILLGNLLFLNLGLVFSAAEPFTQGIPILVESLVSAYTALFRSFLALL